MFTNPDLASRLAREHHHELLAQASRRQLRHQHGRSALGTPGPAARITRRLAAAITGVGSVAAQAPGAVWPTGPRRLGEPAAPAQAPDGSR